MKKIISITILLGLVIASFFLYDLLYKTKLYVKDMYYMDTYIEVKIYSSDKIKAENALTEIDKIYKEYHQLSDRFNAYPGVNNIYYINNNNDKSLSIVLDKKLYDLIEYGITWYDRSNGIKNINIGNVVDVWKKYREDKNGVPTLEELKNAGSIDINDIVLEDNYMILNNRPNIDLGSIAKGYATEVVGDYLKEIGLNKFLINAGGNVLVGDHYDNYSYKIGIQDPINGNEIYQVVKGNNIAVVTSGGYERYYEYDGVRYNHIIDPSTLYPANNFKSVTVICNDSRLGDSLSLVLFVMDLETGKEFIKNFDSVEAIWYVDKDTIIKSDGFSKYE